MTLSPPPTTTNQYGQTVVSIGASAELIATGTRSIGETMDALSEAFALITGDDERQSLGALGLAGVPLMATWRAIRSAAEQLVGQRTGQPLSEWLEFVDAASDQFDAYSQTLDRLEAWTRAAGEPGLDPPTDDDLTMLADVRVETQAWKVLLGQVERVGKLVDAVLDSRGATDTEGSMTKAARSWRDLKDRVPASVAETMGSLGTSDIRDWIFRPLVDLRDQVERLPGSVNGVAEEVSILEVKLDLALVQAESALGRLSTGDIDVVELRIAGTVLVPSLMHRVADARADARTRRNHLDHLSKLRDDGSVGADVDSRLRSRYTEELSAAENRLDQVESELAEWRANGPELIDRARAWIDFELDCLRVRSRIEKNDDLDGRIAMLEAEQRQLAEVAEFLETDEPMPERSA